MRIAAEWDTFMEVEQQMETEQSPTTLQPSGRMSADMFDDADFDTTILHPVDKTAEKETSAINRTASNSTIFNSENKSSDSSKSVFDEIDIDAHLDALDEQMLEDDRCKRAKLDSPVITSNVKTVSLIKKIQDNVTSGKFKVRAQFDGVAQKLTIIDGVWSLKIRVKDETDNLEVMVDNGIIEKMIGIKSRKVGEWKDKILAEDPATEANLYAVSTLKALIVDKYAIIS